ncbi:unnamed protein product [Mytilus coruscus]|uniref:SMB domain-containing protein n=1 Tax=Mytilus coruscus TaxID=42192 RepID=A0A6J8BEP4_MYTCO|nr:unnamed protein product [Mytilus coruscus]
MDETRRRVEKNRTEYIRRADHFQHITVWNQFYKGGYCYCFNPDEQDTGDKHDEFQEKCLSSCSTCREDYVFIYKFNVAESCLGRCKQRYDNGDHCICNTACENHNGCCKDYDDFCSEDENCKWKALQCEGGETSEDSLLVIKSSSNECSDLVSFYFRNGSSAQKRIPTVKSQESNFTTPMKPDKITPPIGSSPQKNSRGSNFTTPLKPDQITPPIGVIVGIVSSIVAIGVVIFVVIVCLRRRHVNYDCKDFAVNEKVMGFWKPEKKWYSATVLEKTKPWLQSHICRRQNSKSLKSTESTKKDIKMISDKGIDFPTLVLQTKRKDASPQIVVTVENSDVVITWIYLFKLQAASEECERQGSFIKWYSDSLCDSPGRQPKHWTSGTRHDETFVMRKACKKFESQ